MNGNNKQRKSLNGLTRWNNKKNKEKENNEIVSTEVVQR